MKMKSTGFLLALLCSAVSGFAPCKNQYASASSSALKLSDRTAEPESATVSRRGLVASAAAAVVGGTYLSFLQTQDSGVPVLDTITSLDDAVAAISSSCDRRFLHAVVASDYRMLYQTARIQKPSIVDASAFPSMESNEVLNSKFLDRPLQPSNSILASNKASKGGNMISLWPLVADPALLDSVDSGVHYAWLEKGGSFVNYNSESTIIVDGVDCGRMSLEDALEGEVSYQVMVRAQRFLAVPQGMERELVAKLRGSFLL